MSSKPTISALIFGLILCSGGCADPAPPSSPSAINETASQPVAQPAKTNTSPVKDSGDATAAPAAPPVEAKQTNAQLFAAAETECAAKKCEYTLDSTLTDKSTGCYVDVQTYKCTTRPLEKFSSGISCAWDDANLKKSNLSGGVFADNQITQIETYRAAGGKLEGYVLKACVGDDPTVRLLVWVKGTSADDWVVQITRVPRN